MPTWVNNTEDSELVGVGARFGRRIESKEKHSNRTRLLLSDPSDCCTELKEKVFLSFLFSNSCIKTILTLILGLCIGSSFS